MSENFTTLETGSEVLILVVMEYTQWGVRLITIKKPRVLILVVMEYTQWAWGCK